MLPGRHGLRQLQGVGPVGQVRSDGDAGFQDVTLVARLQQRDGLLRPQPERCYGPRSDAGLRPRTGRGAGHGAGRHGSVAQGGQPSDCAGEVAVARFLAGRFGQEPGSGAVRVFSSRPRVGRSVARVGVLGPEDQVSLNGGGVEYEHGVIRFCVAASVDDGTLFWQGAEGFRKRLGSIGRVSNAPGGEPTGFPNGPSARNVLVDELITGTQFRQVVELGHEVAGGVAGPTHSRSRVGYADDGLVYAQWPVSLGGTLFEGKNS